MSDLHRAIRRGDKEEIIRLIASGAPVNVAEERPFGYTALMEACVCPATGTDVIKLLLDAGADANAWTQPEDKRRSEPLLKTVMYSITVEEAKLLIAAGADMNACSAKGSTALVTAAGAPFLAALSQRRNFEVFDFLLAAGASSASPGEFEHFITERLSYCGEIARLGKVLAMGEDPSPLQWTPLFHAVAFGDEAEVIAQLDAGADLEHRDHDRRTPFLLAIQAGRQRIAALLLERGADRNAIGGPGGYGEGSMGEWPAGAYPMSQDNAEMLRWLLSSGAVAETAIDELLLIAVHRNATACARLLIEAGADWRYENFRKLCSTDVVVDLEIAKMLVDYGADPARLNSYALKLYIGLGFASTVDLTWQECLGGYYQRFGVTNPERIKIPFWDVMVRGSWHPLQVESWFRHTPGRCEGSLPWCYCREGMSFTGLPDGRFIQIGGSLREGSKPADHWVYNDAILHDGKGGFEILGYPEEIFPPTDHHTATLAGEWIYLIGNLGYPDARGSETPVYRLHVESLMIEKVPATGENPGWIHEHKAALENGRIRISGGKRWVGDPGSSSSIEDLRDSYWFDPATGIWERIAP